MATRPIAGTPNITQEYGVASTLYRKGYHTGVDYAIPTGTPILSPTNGAVQQVGDGRATSDGRGFFMIIRGDDNVTHHLYHLQNWLVSGGRVSEGQHVANSDNTGLSSGPHLHWETRRNDVDFNPAEWLFATPPAPSILSKQRVVGSAGVNERERPDTNAPIARDWQPGEVLNFKGYVRGGSYAGNNIWFVGAINSRYFWSGSFDDTGTHDLPDLTAPVIAPPPPPLEPTPPPPVSPQPYTFTKDLPSVTEVIPAALTNFEYGNFPTNPEKVVIHDFGTKNVDTVGSVINHFTGTNVEVSAHFVVSGKRIIQMVSLKDRAYHAGANGNGFIGIEADPNQDVDTVASVKLLLKDIDAKYGYAPERVKHSSIMPTACGDDIDLANYQPVVAPAEPDLDKENNTLLKQILAIVQWIQTKIGSIFR